LCLNAPTKDKGVVEVGVTREYVNRITDLFGSIPIMIKSTMPMFTDINDPISVWPDNIVYNPEFLTAANAEEDFANQQLFIIGVEGNTITHDTPAEENEQAKFWTNIFAPSLPDTEFVYTDRETAIMVKYTHNAWLATKITFFHTLSQVMPGLSDYNKMTDILAKFPNIGPSHMKVPNALGGLGYEGFCFPKDMKAFERITQSSLVASIVDHNEKLLNETENWRVPKFTEESLQKKIPKNDYIIFIGTSHTFGECDGKRIHSYARLLEEQIGLQVVEVGYSGARNIDLLTITNELNDLGFFNERCKLVILEPRIKDPTNTASIDSIIGEGNMTELLSAENIKTPSLYRTSFAFNDADDKPNLIWKNTTRESLGFRSGPGNLHTAKTRLDERISISANDQSSKKKLVKDIWEKVGDGKAFDSYLNNATYEVANSAQSFLSTYNDLIHVDSIANIVKNKGITFRWFTVDARDYEIAFLRSIGGLTSTIFKDRLVTKSIHHLVLQNFKFNAEIHEFKKLCGHLLCECGHFNQEGNKYIADEIIAPAINNTLNKISRRAE
jgi:hypothetical protein